MRESFFGWGGIHQHHHHLKSWWQHQSWIRNQSHHLHDGNITPTEWIDWLIESSPISSTCLWGLWSESSQGFVDSCRSNWRSK
jgi:hypothetical protein